MLNSEQRQTQEKDDHYTNQIEELNSKLSKANKLNQELRDKNKSLGWSLQEAREQTEGLKERLALASSSKSHQHKSKKSQGSIQSFLTPNGLTAETPVIETARFAAAFNHLAVESHEDRVQQLEAQVRELLRTIEDLKEKEEQQALRNNSSHKYPVIEHSFERILEHKTSNKTFRSIRQQPHSENNENVQDLEAPEGEEEEYGLGEELGEEEQSQNNSIVNLNDRDPDVFWSNIGQNTDRSFVHSRRATDLARQEHQEEVADFDQPGPAGEPIDNESRAPLEIEPRSEGPTPRQSFVEPRDEVDKPSELDEPARKGDSPLLLDLNGVLKDQDETFQAKRALFLRRNSNAQRSGDFEHLKKNQGEADPAGTLKTHKSVKSLKTRPSIALLKQKARMFANQYTKKKLQKSETPDYSRDYLGVSKIQKITKYLKKLEDAPDKLFSDAISLYVAPNKKQKYIFIATCNLRSSVKYILLIVPGAVENIKSPIQLSSIEELILPDKSQVQLVLKSRNSRDMIVECFRRFELIRFLHQVCDSQVIKRFPVTLSSKYSHLIQLLDECRRRQS